MYPVGIINPSLISMDVYQLGGAPCPTAGGGGVNAVSVSDNKLHKVYCNGGRTSTPLCFSLTEDQCYTFCSCCSLVYGCLLYEGFCFHKFIKKNRYFLKKLLSNKNKQKLFITFVSKGLDFNHLAVFSFTELSLLACSIHHTGTLTLTV